MSQVFSVKSMMSGLNNQRMGLVGLIAYAARHRGKAVLPAEVVDFSPGIGRSPSDYGRLPFNEVFDEDILLSGAAGEYLTSQPANEVLGLDKCFAEGAAILTEARTLDTEIHRLARHTLLSLEPTEDIRMQAKHIAQWLPASTHALQLRIERDWQEYLVRKFGSMEVSTDHEFLTTSAEKIAQKVGNSNLNLGAIWGCCDEADLTVSLPFIRDFFNKIGVDIKFKSDLPSSLQYPKQRINRAFLEFAVCRELSGYIGLSRSSFSQLLWLDNLWKQERRKPHYVYNTPHSALTRR